jgi:hypothetical protein
MTDVGPLKQTPGLMTKDDAEGLAPGYAHGSVAYHALLTVIALHDQINEAGEILSPGALFKMSTGDDIDSGEEIPTTLKERAEMVVMALSAEAQEATRANDALRMAGDALRVESTQAAQLTNELHRALKDARRLRAELTRLRAQLKGLNP